MLDRLTPQLAALILRLSLGLVLLAHSLYLKMVVFTLPGTAEFFDSVGLPGLLAYGVFLIEVLAGTGLIAGWHSRVWALAVIPVLLGATWVHAGNGWLFTNTGGGWEYPLFLTAMAVVQLCLGDGQYALNARQSFVHHKEPHQ
ncbi:DoxX family protein [Halomonas sp. ATBC28]|uniref:DoxX family protein n=1 Tax=Halomonadaceae TaxID=28256 RepID=UPI00034AF930|nr:MULTISPECIES: DoxX family protein [Halomonas]NAO96522.1 DoxX family membrane protein [Halomonas sp. MG34]QGQ69730.1 DoxX family protein [Halomonas sp. PA16-9]KIN16121.1 membrane protein [Halomonas sp. KHS3]MCE7516768.1 DoxX family protein [Halomonas titanicae]NVE90942.1 DoxX family protein [Halomonas titanicae]|tara:strand:- start:529 stop:957 length:429 start_codon:yes stop_codon:yes gene_type:complete